MFPICMIHIRVNHKSVFYRKRYVDSRVYTKEESFHDNLSYKCVGLSVQSFTNHLSTWGENKFSQKELLYPDEIMKPSATIAHAANQIFLTSFFLQISKRF